MIPNAKNEIVLIRLITNWRECMEYRMINIWTKNYHYPMSFKDQMLDHLARKGWYCFLDGYSSYNQISIATEYQNKTTLPCPYGTFVFKRMTFGLCNAPTTFQCYMMLIFMIWWRTQLRYVIPQKSKVLG